MNDPKIKREKQPAHTTTTHTIRFPVELYERLHAEAVRQSRSFNGQVVYMLREALSPGTTGEKDA